MSRVQQAGHGLGSDIILTLGNIDESHANPIFQSLWALINSFEERFSRFKVDSELTHFNQAAGGNVAVSDDFKALLEASIDASNYSNGLYNPLTLPALQQAGYKSSWPEVDKKDSQTDFSSRQSVNPISSIEILGNTVRIPAFAALDFGGIGKGYLLDKLADFLDAEHITNYWLSLGGDIVMRGENGDNGAWKVGVAKADDPESVVTYVANDGGVRMAVATSGVTKRKGENWHHIIDPRTGLSAITDLLTVTAIDESATRADVIAKCLVIVGSETAAGLVKNFAPLNAIGQKLDGSTVETLHYKGSDES